MEGQTQNCLAILAVNHHLMTDQIQPWLTTRPPHTRSRMSR